MQTTVQTNDDVKKAAARRLEEMGLVDPTDRPEKLLSAPARLDSLAGKRPGLLDNRKGNGDRLLDRIGQVLVEQYGTREPYRTTKWIYSRRAADDILEDLAANCDFVVTAIGD